MILVLKKEREHTDQKKILKDFQDEYFIHPKKKIVETLAPTH